MKFGPPKVQPGGAMGGLMGNAQAQPKPAPANQQFQHPMFARPSPTPPSPAPPTYGQPGRPSPVAGPRPQPKPPAWNPYQGTPMPAMGQIQPMPQADPDFVDVTKGPSERRPGAPQQWGGGRQAAMQAAVMGSPSQRFSGNDRSRAMGDMRARIGMPQGGRPPPMFNPYVPQQQAYGRMGGQARPARKPLNWQQQQMRTMPAQMRQMYNGQRPTASQPMQPASWNTTMRGRPAASRVNLQRNQF